jgi:hypothetical protein
MACVASAQVCWNRRGLARTGDAVAKNQRRARQFSIISAVVALHVAVVWVLLAATPPVLSRPLSQSLQLVFIVPMNTAPESPVRKPAPRSQQSAPPNATPPSPVELNPAPPSEEGSAIHPPIDWAGELERIARDSTSDESSRKPLNFGFPHASTAPSTRPREFAWSYAPTHRIESIPGGGLLVNLNDNCVLVFAPLPFFACALGRKPANGDLFMHMHDPSQPGSGGVPE